MMEDSPLQAIRLRTDLTVASPEDGRVAVALPDGGRCFLFSDQEYLLAMLLQAHGSFDPLASEFFSRTGRTVSPEKLEAFILQLKDFELLVGSERKLEVQKNSWRQTFLKLARIEVPFFNPDRSLEYFLPLAKALFTREFTAIATFMIAIALVQSLSQRQELTLSLTAPSLSPPVKLLLAWFAVGLVGLVHEYGHGLSCKFYGGRVPRMGAMLYFLVPMAFCDVNASSTFPKKRRLTVALSGLYAQGLLGGFALLLLGLFPFPPTGDYFLSQLVFLSLFLGWLNLIPLVKMDGYYLLCDLSGVVNLRPRALALLKKWLLSQWVGEVFRPESREEKFLLLYGVLGSLASVGMAIAGLYLAISLLF